MLVTLKAIFHPLLSAVSLPGLALLSFIEAIFFPIPPDTLLMPLVLRVPALAVEAAFVAAVSSVAGACVGYFIGLRGGRPVLLRFTSHEKIARVEELYRKYDMGSILIAGFTPIPYKVFAVSAGVFRISFVRFLSASLVSRSARFLVEALLVAAYGPTMVSWIEEYFGQVTLGVAVLAVLLWWAWRFFSRPAAQSER